MKKEDLDLFVDASCAAFPGLLELLDKSPATVVVWGRTLDGVSYDEAASVLDRWIVGTLSNPPVGFRREEFALNVLSVVNRDRSDARRRKQNEQVLTKSHRDNYVPSVAFKSIAKEYFKMCVLKDERDAGTITHEQCQASIDDIVRNFNP